MNNDKYLTDLFCATLYMLTACAVGFHFVSML